jgi:hypothetical protein
MVPPDRVKVGKGEGTPSRVSPTKVNHAPSWSYLGAPWPVRLTPEIGQCALDKPRL